MPGLVLRQYLGEDLIDADLIGIAKLVKQSIFSVPPHQRPYAWLEGQVMDLYRDINDALKRDKEEYFLGPIILAKGGAATRERPTRPTRCFDRSASLQRGFGNRSTRFR